MSNPLQTILSIHRDMVIATGKQFCSIYAAYMQCEAPLAVSIFIFFVYFARSAIEGIAK